MTCTPAPSCVAALAQASRLWPGRRTTSDGICASAQHHRQNPRSDHEPHVVVNGRAYATAFDLSDDKAAGCDADALVEQLRQRRDPRIKYVIAEQRMFSSYPTSSHPAWTWRPYSGANPHSSHVHVSIVPEAIHDTGPWWPTPHQEEPDMTEGERKLLLAIHHHIAGDADEGARLPRLIRQVDALTERVAELEREGR